jgi:hypothetical protein
MSIFSLNLMTDTEYSAIFWGSIRKLRSLIEQRDETELEISKVRQFARATINMLPDDERQKMEKLLDAVNRSDNLNRVGLADAIKNVLENSPKRWFTVAQVRDVLRDTGFDFSRYTSNPLSSVSTTLKRFKSPDIESTEIDEVTAYRWKDTKAARKRRAERADMDAIIDIFESKDIPDEERIVERGEEG